MLRHIVALVKYLTSSQKPYLEIIRSTNQFTEEAETSLKAIAESKKLLQN
jgi:hypothetical protein